MGSKFSNRLRMVLTAIPYFKLLGFFLYIALYVVMTESYRRHPPHTRAAGVYKLLPVMQLIFICYSTSYDFMHFRRYRRKIVMGLALSAAGDFCLLMRDTLFVPALMFFTLAQFCYIRAFGFHHPCRPTGLALLGVGTAVCGYLVPHIDSHLMRLLVGLYITVIVLMSWRAMVLFHASPCVGTFASCGGAFLFAHTDFLIAYDRWVEPIPYAPLLVLVTYYAAQLGFALSVACYKAPFWVLASEGSGRGTGPNDLKSRLHY